MATDQDKRVCLGVITGATGVKGEVKIKPYTQVPQDVGAYGPVVLVSEAGEEKSGVEVEVVRAAKEVVVARLSGVEDRDAAEALRGFEMYVSRDLLPGEEEDEYYHADLIGLAAQDLGGATLGTVIAVHDFGAGEMLEVELVPKGVAMIPFTKAAVPQVLIGEGRIVVDPPDGVLPEPKAPKDRSGGAKSGKRKKKPKGGSDV
jgi:16S rRNA processing protein RimM